MRGKRLTLGLLILGVMLIIGSVGYYAWMRYSVKENAADAKKTVDKMYTLMPELTNGVPDERSNTTMSSLEIDGDSFVGIIEVPVYESKLPIYASWDTDKLNRFPCRFFGSVYNKTLMIGGSENDGQFDFITQISLGDSVCITDTMGVRYTFQVSSIRRCKDISADKLLSEESSLIFFAKNSLDFDYVVVYCN